jgi:hypothetical protein
VEYHEHLTKASVLRLVNILEAYETDPATVAFALIYLGDRIGKSISPATHEEAVSGVLADAVSTLIGKLNYLAKVASTKW